MSEKSFVSSLLSRLSSSSNRRLKRAARRSAQPAEQLEARELLSAITVDALHDVSDANDGETTLREAVAIANQDPATPDTITFDESFDFDVVRLTQGQLTLSGNIVIDASANGLMRVDQDKARNRVLNVSSDAEIELRNLVIQGGDIDGSSARGAGILNSGSLTLESSLVGANYLNYSQAPTTRVFFGGGAGIYNTPTGDLELLRSSVGAVRVDLSTLDSLGIDPDRFFTDDEPTTPYLVGPNVSRGVGGGILNEGQMTLTESSVVDNRAAFGGGGIFNAGSAELIDSTVTENQAGNRFTFATTSDTHELGHNGAGIFNAERIPVRFVRERPNPFVPWQYSFGYRDSGYTGDTHLELVRSTVRDHSGQFGAGIFNEVATLDIVRSSVSNNTTSNKGQDGIKGGAGLFVASGNVSINTSTFSDNTSHDNGGAIQAIDNREIYIESSTFSGNQANRGGAIYVDSSANSVGRPMTVVHSTITNNTASQAGGIWVTQAGRETILGSIVAGNTASAFPNIAAAGGIIRSAGSNLIGPVSSDEFLERSPDIINVADAGLGPLGDFGGPTQTHALLPNSPALNALPDGTSADLEFDQRGLARVDGPSLDIGAFEARPPASLKVDTLSDVVDGFYGPGDLSLREAILWAKELPGPDEVGFADSLISDVITSDGGFGTITLTETLVLDDDVSIVGPGADVISISGNDQFGVVRVTAGADVGIHGVTITDGQRTGAGAGIENYGNLRVTDTAIAYNESAGDTHGAGIFNHHGSTLFLEGSTVHNNTAGNAGGGIYVRGEVTIVNSTISNNAAQQGAGLYGHQGTAEIINSTVTENTATLRGGAMRNWQSVVTVTNSIVADNEAPDGPEWFTSYGDRQISGGSNFIGIGAPGFTDGVNNDIVGTSATPLDPKLGFLSDAGASLPVHRPLPGSPVIDEGRRIDYRADQLDNRRGVESTPEIGAIEFFTPDVPSGPIVVNATVGNADGYFAAGELQLSEALLLASLRDGEDDIHFDESLLGQTIELGGQELVADSEVNLIGPGADLLSISARGLSRVMHVTPGSKVRIRNLAIGGGWLEEANAHGAGILNEGDLKLTDTHLRGNYHGGEVNTGTRGGGVYNGGRLTVLRSTLSGGAADQGGGIYNDGRLDVVNSTISSHSAQEGGNVYNASGLANFTNSTVAYGHAQQAGIGGVLTAAGAEIRLRNTIIANSDDNTAGGEIRTESGGTAVTRGGNLIMAASPSEAGFTPLSTDQMGTFLNRIDPKLSRLYAASTEYVMPVHRLLPGSPAIDTGVSGSTNDQRLVSRPQGSRNDVGAVEMEEFILDGPLVVDNLGTDINGDYSEGDLTLAEAILLTNALDSTTGTDVVEFSPAMIDQIIATVERSATIRVPTFSGSFNRVGYEITDSLIIKDPAAHRNDVEGHDVLTIEGWGGGSIFDIRADADVTIEGLRLADAGWHSGAIYAINANITLDNVVIENNDTTGVSIENGSLTIRDSVIRGNSHRGIEGSGSDVTIVGSVVTNNQAPNGVNSFGGGVQIVGGNLSIEQSEVSDNSAEIQGGGVYLWDGTTATISYSTISNNSAEDDVAGGIFTQPGATLDLLNVTIAENTAGRQAGGVYLLGTTTMTNTLVGNNEAPSIPDGWGTVTAIHSLSGTDWSVSTSGITVANPHLGPLADNGGSTRTHQIRPGSPAIDAGLSGTAIVDQRGRGLVDIAGLGTSVADIGAYEIQSVGSSTFNYGVYDQSQFGPGDALTYGFGFDDGRTNSSIDKDPKFLGFEFDTGNLKAGKITSGKIKKSNKYGGEINSDFAGKFGFDLGFYINSGSLDVGFDGQHNYIVDTDGNSATIQNFIEITDGSLYTVSPKISGYADLVMQLDAEVSATGCFVGCASKEFLDIKVDKTIEAFSLNRHQKDFYKRPMFFAVGEVFTKSGNDYIPADGEIFARASNGNFHDLADTTTPLDFYEFRNGGYVELDRAPVTPFLDGEIRLFDVELIPVEDLLDAAKTANEFKSAIKEQVRKYNAASKVRDAQKKEASASNDLDRLHEERDAAKAAQENADTAGEYIRQRDRLEQINKDITGAEDRLIDASRDRKEVEADFEAKHGKKNGNRRIKSPTQYIQVEFGEADGSLLGVQADLVVGVGATTPFGNIGASLGVGSLAVTLPDVNLGTNTLNRIGALQASTDSFPVDSELDDKRQLADLRVDLAALLGPYFGIPAGKYSLDLGPLGMDITTVSYNFGPRLNVTQDVKAEPVVEGMTYEFFAIASRDPYDHDDDPGTPPLEYGAVPGEPMTVDVEIDGELFDDVQTISFDAGQRVEVISDTEVLVVPTMQMDTRVTNDIGLEVALKGNFEAFALGLTAFGKSIIDTGPLLKHRHTAGSFNLGSVFRKTFELDNPQDVSMAPFTLFQTSGNGQASNTALQPEPIALYSNRAFLRADMPVDQNVFVSQDMDRPDGGNFGAGRYWNRLTVSFLEGPGLNPEAPSLVQLVDPRLSMTETADGFQIDGITPEVLNGSDSIVFAMMFDTLGERKFKTQRSLTRHYMPAGPVTENLGAVNQDVLDAISPSAVFTTDIDGDGLSVKATDGVLLTRYAKGLRGNALINGAIGDGATRTTATAIADFIEDSFIYDVHIDGTVFSSIDFDGNSAVNGFDTKLFRKYLDGVRGSALVDGTLGNGATRTTGEAVVDFIELNRAAVSDRNDEALRDLQQTTEDVYGVADALDYSRAKSGSSPYSGYLPEQLGTNNDYTLTSYRNWVNFTETYYQAQEADNLLSRSAKFNPEEFGPRHAELLAIDENNNGTPDLFEDGIADELLVTEEFTRRIGVAEPLFVKAPEGAGHQYRMLTDHLFRSFTIDRRVGDNLLLPEEFDLFRFDNGWWFDRTINTKDHTDRDGLLTFEFAEPVDRFRIYATDSADEELDAEENLSQPDLLHVIGFTFANPNGDTEKPRLRIARLATPQPITDRPPIVKASPHPDDTLAGEFRIARARENIHVYTEGNSAFDHEFQIVATPEIRVEGNDATDDVLTLDGRFGPLRSRIDFDGGFRQDTITVTGSDIDLNFADGLDKMSGVEVIDIRGDGRNSIIIDLDVVRENDPVNKTLRVITDTDDKFVRRAGWRRGGRVDIEGLSYVRWLQKDALLLLATADNSPASAPIPPSARASAGNQHERTDMLFSGIHEKDDEDLFAI